MGKPKRKSKKPQKQRKQPNNQQRLALERAQALAVLEEKNFGKAQAQTQAQTNTRRADLPETLQSTLDAMKAERHRLLGIMPDAIYQTSGDPNNIFGSALNYLCSELDLRVTVPDVTDATCLPVSSEQLAQCFKLYRDSPLFNLIEQSEDQYASSQLTRVQRSMVASEQFSALVFCVEMNLSGILHGLLSLDKETDPDTHARHFSFINKIDTIFRNLNHTDFLDLSTKLLYLRLRESQIDNHVNLAIKQSENSSHFKKMELFLSAKKRIDRLNDDTKKLNDPIMSMYICACTIDWYANLAHIGFELKDSHDFDALNALMTSREKLDPNEPYQALWIYLAKITQGQVHFNYLIRKHKLKDKAPFSKSKPKTEKINTILSDAFTKAKNSKLAEDLNTFNPDSYQSTPYTRFLRSPRAIYTMVAGMLSTQCTIANIFTGIGIKHCMRLDGMFEVYDKDAAPFFAKRAVYYKTNLICVNFFAAHFDLPVEFARPLINKLNQRIRLTYSVAQLSNLMQDEAALDREETAETWLKSLRENAIRRKRHEKEKRQRAAAEKRRTRDALNALRPISPVVTSDSDATSPSDSSESEEIEPITPYTLPSLDDQAALLAPTIQTGYTLFNNGDFLKAERAYLQGFDILKLHAAYTLQAVAAHITACEARLERVKCCTNYKEYETQLSEFNALVKKTHSEILAFLQHCEDDRALRQDLDAHSKLLFCLTAPRWRDIKPKKRLPAQIKHVRARSDMFQQTLPETPTLKQFLPHTLLAQTEPVAASLAPSKWEHVGTDHLDKLQYETLNYEIPLPTTLERLISLITDSARTHQMLVAVKCFVVGGAVRDNLLSYFNLDHNRTPHDFDLMVDIDHETLKSLLDRNEIPYSEVGKTSKRHLIVKFENEQYEFTTVQKGFEIPSLYQNATTRDCWVNACAYDVAEKVIHIPHAATVDFQTQTLRIIGDHPAERFKSDPGLLFRFLYLKSLLNFTIDPVTWTAIQETASSVHTLNPGRLQHELKRILRAPHARNCMSEASALGLLNPILSSTQTDALAHTHGALYRNLIACATHIDTAGLSGQNSLTVVLGITLFESMQYQLKRAMGGHPQADDIAYNIAVRNTLNDAPFAHHTYFKYTDDLYFIWQHMFKAQLAFEPETLNAEQEVLLDVSQRAVQDNPVVETSFDTHTCRV